MYNILLALSLILILCILYALFGHILLTLFLSLLSKSSIKKEEDYLPEVCFMIAAFNEEAFMAKKLRNTLGLDYPKDLIKIVVVSDGSTDQTDEIVRGFENEGIELVRVEGRVGKTEARNQAIKERTEDIIIFSDATAIYEKDAVRKLVRNFADETIGMVSGKLSYFDQTSSHMGRATKLYWSYEQLIKKSQSRLRTLTGAVGCINAFRRELYYHLPANVIEDFTFPIMVVAQGKRVIFEPEAIAYERTTQNSSQEFKMRLRVIRGGMTGFRFALPKLILAKQWSAIIQLFSHKVMRWLMPIFLILLFLVTLLGAFAETHSILFKTLFILQTIAYGLGLLGIYFPKNKIMGFANYFLIMNSASLSALIKTFSEELEATWDTNIY
ncbi:MAG: glycosyl transferase family 2 [Halobacteriovoraceae bacterium]|nr:glycosyl transferase family 2 [Halobacteriovoraceae bacterium]MBC98390.1 glycosyl transferase family 2 [Halobacteriovoraceae bacterium]|tara:strand:+ start:29882 stop:31033 length:1152 start_codon:yes stop_codon:yes gene_type:complete